MDERFTERATEAAEEPVARVEVVHSIFNRSAPVSRSSELHGVLDERGSAGLFPLSTFEDARVKRRQQSRVEPRCQKTPLWLMAAEAFIFAPLLCKL